MSIQLLREYVRLLVESDKPHGISEDIFKYASSVDNPGHCIRFTEDIKHIPDANRKGLHTSMVNGVYTFPAEKRYLNDLVEMAKPPKFNAKKYEEDYLMWYVGWMKNEFTEEGDKSWNSNSQPRPEEYCDISATTGLSQYLEDIMMINAPAIFVLKNLSKKPYTITSKKDLTRLSTEEDPNKPMGNVLNKSFDAVAIQKTLLAEGYDAIYDPQDFIDECGMPQICFLDNSAFHVIEALATNSINYDDLRDAIRATTEFKQINKRVRKKAENIVDIYVPSNYIHGPSEAD